MSAELEGKVLSAVLKDKQIHILLQSNPDSLFKTHKDVWEFIRNYQEQNSVVPSINLVIEKFRDFDPQGEIGSTKHHLEELRVSHLQNSLSSILMDTATKLKTNEPVEALLITIFQRVLLLVSLAFFLPILLLVSLGSRYLWLFKHGRTEESHYSSR